MYEVQEVNRLSDLDCHRGVWEKLLLQTPNFTLFQTLEWLEAIWHNYPLRQKLRVLLLCRGGEPTGIVPLCVRTERRRVGKLRVLTYPLDEWGVFYGPIGPDPKTAMRAAIGHIAETRRDWDMIDLRWVDEASDEFLAIGESLREHCFDFHVRPRDEIRICRLAGGWDAYLASRSRNWRRKMRCDIELLERRGPVRHVRYRPLAGDRNADRHDEIYDLCARISENSWQAGDPSQSSLCSPRVRTALRRVHHAAAALGMLDVNVLYVGDVAAAFYYNYVAEGRVYGLRCAYDSTLELDGCGRVLLFKMLEDSFKRGDVEHNFGPGRQAYKDRYATEMRMSYCFRHYARLSLRSQLLHLRDCMAERVWPTEKLKERSLVS